MIILDKIAKRFGARVLFENVNMTFSNKERYAITGPNGCGKSTLLKIIMGLEEPTEGKAYKPKKVGFLKQNIEDFKDFKVIDSVIYGNERLYEAMAKRDDLYELDITDEIGMELAEMEEIIAEENGYVAEAEAEELLIGMGIEKEVHQMKLNQLPLDRQFRALLCQALFGHPEALLLDEPTNHLDLESITWLEDFLNKYSGCVIVISHDRYFLNSIATNIADIDYDTMILYPGNYDDMILMKTKVRERTEKEEKNKVKKIEKLSEFITKFGAEQELAKLNLEKKEIEKLNPQDLKKSNIARPYIRFYPSEITPGKLIYKVNNLSKSYDGNEVIKKFSFEVERGDKIAVIGNNGLGKTTLLKLLCQEIEPTKGLVKTGHNVILGYFPQNHSDIMKKEKNVTVFDWLKSKKDKAGEVEIRSVLGKLLFAGDDAFKELTALSGGETARVILAYLMLLNPNTIVLDEPNNHLDLEAVSALGWGIEEFKGTAIFASHDRDLISTVANKIISFEDDKIIFFNGGLEDYLEKKDHVKR